MNDELQDKKKTLLLSCKWFYPIRWMLIHNWVQNQNVLTRNSPYSIYVGSPGPSFWVKMLHCN